MRALDRLVGMEKKSGHKEAYTIYIGLCPSALQLGRWLRRTGRKPERKLRSEGRSLLLG